jgi:hypothetical protein
MLIFDCRLLIETAPGNQQSAINNQQFQLLNHNIPLEPVGFLLTDVLADFLVELRP